MKNRKKLIWAKIENPARVSISSVGRSDPIELKISGNTNLTTTCNILKNHRNLRCSTITDIWFSQRLTLKKRYFFQF